MPKQVIPMVMRLICARNCKLSLQLQLQFYNICSRKFFKTVCFQPNFHSGMLSTIHNSHYVQNGMLSTKKYIKLKLKQIKKTKIYILRFLNIYCNVKSVLATVTEILNTQEFLLASSFSSCLLMPLQFLNFFSNIYQNPSRFFINKSPIFSNLSMYAQCPEVSHFQSPPSPTTGLRTFRNLKLGPPCTMTKGVKKKKPIQKVFLKASISEKKLH